MNLTQTNIQKPEGHGLINIQKDADLSTDNNKEIYLKEMERKIEKRKLEVTGYTNEKTTTGY